MSEILDQGALDSLLTMVGDDPDFVDELVDAYLDDAPQQIAAIGAATNSGEPGDLVRPAHTLKGSSATLGARMVEAISRSIEERARAGSIDGVTELQVDLDIAYEALLTALTDARQRRWSAP